MWQNGRDKVYQLFYPFTMKGFSLKQVASLFYSHEMIGRRKEDL